MKLITKLDETIEDVRTVKLKGIHVSGEGTLIVRLDCERCTITHNYEIADREEIAALVILAEQAGAELFGTEFDALLIEARAALEATAA